MVAADVAQPLHRFRNLRREAPSGLNTPEAGQIDLPLHHRDEIALDRKQDDRGNAKHGILCEEEDHRRRQRAALQGRVGDRDAHVAADRLHFGGGHGDDLAAGDAPQPRQREAENPVVEVEPQPAQQRLADHALIGAERIPQRAGRQHERKQQSAEDQEKGQLVQCDAEVDLGEVRRFAADRLVQDDLRQLEGDVQQGQIQRGRDQDDDLLARAVLEDVAQDGLGHVPVPGGP